MISYNNAHCNILNLLTEWVFELEACFWWTWGWLGWPGLDLSRLDWAGVGSKWLKLVSSLNGFGLFEVERNWNGFMLVVWGTAVMANSLWTTNWLGVLQVEADFGWAGIDLGGLQWIGLARAVRLMWSVCLGCRCSWVGPTRHGCPRGSWSLNKRRLSAECHPLPSPLHHRLVRKHHMHISQKQSNDYTQGQIDGWMERWMADPWWMGGSSIHGWMSVIQPVISVSSSNIYRSSGFPWNVLFTIMIYMYTMK